MEFRMKDCQLQADEDGSLRVGGYINVTERESEMLFNKRNGKWFKEIMKKGVFQRAIDKAKANIPLLFEHNWDKQLASIEEGSLTLREDNVGLRFDATIKDESIYQQVRAGLINSCSFGFKALSEEVESVNSRLEKRLVNAIELVEVSLVKNPAYVGSLCETRSYEEEIQEDEKNGAPLDEETKEETIEEELEGETEKVQDDTEEDEEPLSAEKEDSDDVPSEDVNRSIDESVICGTIGVEAKEVDKAYLREIVEEIIDAKMDQLERAQEVEVSLAEEAQRIVEIHETIEAEVEQEKIKQNAEIIKLRLELLKLKHVKEGI